MIRRTVREGVGKPRAAVRATVVEQERDGASIDLGMIVSIHWSSARPPNASRRGVETTCSHHDCTPTEH